jgi:SAM-dependent methyltransferase
MNNRAPIRFDDVADLYDDYVTTDFDIPFWQKEAASVNGKVLELMSGTGRVSLPLLRAGIDLTCVDYAEKMLDGLKRKLIQNGFSCPVYCQDVSELSLPEHYDLIFIPFHSFSEIVDRGRQRNALQAIRRHLKEGGSFICSLQNPVVRTAEMDGTLKTAGEFSGPNGRKVVVQHRMTYDSAAHIASGMQMYELRSSEHATVEHRSLEVNFYLFEKSEFESLADKTGFRVTNLFGDYSGSPFAEKVSQFMIWKLEKKG